jgi:hypothetical protein
MLSTLRMTFYYSRRLRVFLDFGGCDEHNAGSCMTTM